MRTEMILEVFCLREIGENKDIVMNKNKLKIV